ncbi:hypothetical protein HGRIS_010407 [Hohenbuehelia grisea]|uniref:Uncharacterized protein n=1 Tax=Hohenbuehelia grisea TaxID=104357 RepID=A0ABR3J4M7_9AGAR
MHASRTLRTLACPLALLVLATSVVEAINNVTVDDSSSDISYVGNWTRSTIGQSPANYGGSHAVTMQANASAMLSFTGVAVYFMSPRWPYAATTQIQLDGEQPELVDLSDINRSVRPNSNATTMDDETVQSKIVWSRAGLENKQHQLRISVGHMQPFAVIDAIIYTTLSGAPSKKPSSLAVAVGSVCAGAGLALLVAAFLCYRRRRRHQKAVRVEGWAKGRGGSGTGTSRSLSVSSSLNGSKYSSSTVNHPQMASYAHPAQAGMPVLDEQQQQSLAAYYAWAQAHAAAGVPPPPIPINAPPSAYTYAHTQPRYTIATLSTISEASASPWSNNAQSLLGSPAGSLGPGVGLNGTGGTGASGAGEFGHMPLPSERDGASSQYFTPQSRTEDEKRLSPSPGPEQGPPGYTPRR